MNRKLIKMSAITLLLSSAFAVSANAEVTPATFPSYIGDVNIGSNLVINDGAEYIQIDCLNYIGIVPMWSESTKTLTVLGQGKEVVMPINKTVVTVNGEQLRINKPVIKENNVVYAPLADICNIFGYGIHWDWDTSVLSVQPALDVVVAYQDSGVYLTEKFADVKIRINNKMKQMSRDMLVVVKEDEDADISAVEEFNKFMISPNGLVYGWELKEAITSYAPNMADSVYNEMIALHNYLYKCDNIVTFVPIVKYTARKDITVVFATYMSDRTLTVDETFAEFNQYYEDTTGRLLSEAQKAEAISMITSFVDKINNGCVYSYMIYNGEIIQIEVDV